MDLTTSSLWWVFSLYFEGKESFFKLSLLLELIISLFSVQGFAWPACFLHHSDFFSLNLLNFPFFLYHLLSLSFILPFASLLPLPSDAMWGPPTHRNPTPHFCHSKKIQLQHHAAHIRAHAAIKMHAEITVVLRFLHASACTQRKNCAHNHL